MNISARCEYGLRAVLELALHEKSHETLTANAIARRRRIPGKFLVHILLQLKRAGLVRSVRGASGGYSLALPAEKISICDIIEAIDGPLLGGLPIRDSGSHDLAHTWKKLSKEVTQIFSKTTLKDVMSASDKSKMYYI